jgi:hypothetical protein
MPNQHPRYLAYMLRLWRAWTDGEDTWRASLESADTGDRRGFADLEALFAFLKQEINTQQPCEMDGRSDKPPTR